MRAIRKSVGEVLNSQEAINKRLEKLFKRQEYPPSDSKGKRYPPEVDITNRKLCDDAVQYLAPSLEAYKGCTIIDIHPGACQWSTSLHDFLKPKRHILMEPEKKYIRPFIKPLLDQPESTYRHTPLSGAHPRSYWDNYNTIMNNTDLMDVQPSLSQDDPKLRQMNTNILITGNLARKYGAEGLRLPIATVPFAQLILHHFAWAGITNNLFHRSGLVRMLLWAPEVYKHNIIPPVVSGNTSFNMGLKLAGTIDEVVGITPNLDLYKRYRRRTYIRHPGLVALSNERIVERMREDGRHIPEGRSIVQYLDGEGNEYEERVGKAKTEEAEDEELMEEQDIDELQEEQGVEELEADRDNNDEDIGPIGEVNPTPEVKSFVEVPEDDTVEKLKADIDDIEGRFELYTQTHAEATAIKQMTPARKQYIGFLEEIKHPQIRNTLLKERYSLIAIKLMLETDLTYSMINLEARYSALEEQGQAVSPLKQRLFTIDNRITEELETASYRMRLKMEEHLEDQFAFFTSPETQSWDSRRYEPLRSSLQDFWPRFSLSLLDTTPAVDRDLAVPGIVDSSEAMAGCHQILKYMYMNKNHALPPVLDRIAPNAARDLIPMTPGLTDARKGGRLNPERLKVRMMTPEMLLGLMRAWFEWPFRLSRWELERSTASYADPQNDSE